MQIKIKKLHPHATIPEYQSQGAAGFDLVSLERGTILPKGGVGLFKTGLAVEVPEGYELQVRSRSGLSYKNQIVVGNSPGTVDSDYRGEIMVILYNLSSQTYTVNVGDRIAQGLVTPVVKVEFEVVEELSETERGAGGHGSTGK